MKTKVGPRNLRRNINFCRVFVLAVITATSLCSFAATDVLFLVDTTGSMSGLVSFKTAFKSIITAIENNSSCADGVMYALADHRNYNDGGNYAAYGMNLDLPFTYSVQEAQGAIDGLLAGGPGSGGDGPESQLKAMISITNNWLTTSGNLGFNGRHGAQRILVWAGDAPGHVVGDEWTGSPPAGYYPAFDTVIDALTNQGIVVFALNAADDNNGLNEPYRGHQQADEITIATGGLLFNEVGSGSSAIENAIVTAITCLPFEKEDDLDNQDPTDCRSPSQELKYTISWANNSGHTLENAYIIDWLPSDVSYPQAAYTIEFGDPNDPNQPPFTMLPPDPGYDKGTHSYVWPLYDLAPNASGQCELTVTVNDSVMPGQYLHNIAELWADINDANNVPVPALISRFTKDTLVCCYITPEILYVDSRAAAGGNGFSWAKAFTSLQDALAYARSAPCAQVQSIYVAQGTYFPGTNENDSFDLTALPGIALYGGFPTGGCDFSLRNPKRYQTTLSGKIDDTHRNTTVLRMGSNTILDGFAVTESARSFSAGSISGSEVDFEIANCKIERNLGYGAYMQNCNATFLWCNFLNNALDGIRHTGESKSLILENVLVRQSGQYGVYCLNSVPIVINSILSESDIALEGRAGLMMVNSPQRPYLQNVTVAHNKTQGIWRAGGAMPEIFNSIVYHNGGEALVGFSADEAAMYSCIEDANSINGNIYVDPQFAYFDPNNVRLSPESDCRHASAPLYVVDYNNQMDMDGNPRVSSVDLPPDMGAYEMVCDINVSSDWDWNADGLVNYSEFTGFSKAWMGHDPNDPAWLANPEIGDPNLSEGWYEWKSKYNVATSGESAYSIDLADIVYFAEESPWLWRACWVNLEEMQVQPLVSGGDMMILGDEMLFSAAATTSEPVVEEKTVQEQMLELASAITFFEQIWLEEPDLQQEISAEDWQEFMDAIYQNLLDLQTNEVQFQ